MESTTRFHDGLAKLVLQEAYFGCHHTGAFHPANGVFDTDSDRGARTIGRLLRWGEFPTRGCFLGLDHDEPLARLALEPHILIKTTATWEGIAFQISQAFLIRLPFIGRTQEAHMTGLLNHEEVVERVALLLATGVVLLVRGIGGAMDRSRRAIMAKREDVGAPFVGSAASRTAKSSAVRAGRRSGCAHVRFNTAWRR
jgi:hypothetical protein